MALRLGGQDDTVAPLEVRWIESGALDGLVKRVLAAVRSPQKP
jgi:hypothetical protein